MQNKTTKTKLTYAAYKQRTNIQHEENVQEKQLILKHDRVHCTGTNKRKKRVVGKEDKTIIYISLSLIVH